MLWRLELGTINTPRMASIKNLNDLAVAIGMPAPLLIRRAFHTTLSLLYTYEVQAKRDGTYRGIHIPHWPLKFMQYQLKVLLDELYRPSSRVHGFVKGKSVRTNAMPHVGKRLIFNVDVHDFFGSINFARVRGRLMSPPYGVPNQVATAIARLCTLNDALPIGAPSSPVLANMICSRMDFELTQLARESGCFYTRYADDITVSTHRSRMPAGLVELAAGQRSGTAIAGPELEAIVQSNGFSLNSSKTRLLSRSDSQQVCGIVCNQRLNPRRKLRRELRAMMHAWRKFGYDSAERTWKQQHNWRGAKSFERSVRGKLEFLIHVRGEDDAVVNSLVEQFNALPGRSFREIRYPFRGGWKDRLQKTVCVVESGDDSLVEYKQGSGFVIRNDFVITNAHNVVIAGNLAPSILIRFPDHLHADIEVEVVSLDQASDIAILKPKDGMWQIAISNNSSDLSFARPAKDQAAWIAGFPSYQVGDSVRLDVSQIVGTRIYDGIEHFRISSMIVKGNSGGPIINNDGYVIGIATKGIDTDDVVNVHQNGCLYLGDFASLVVPLIQ